MAKEKYAIRTLRRGPDGQIKAIFVDATTGKELNDLNGYNVVESGQQTTIPDLDLDVKNSKDNKKQNTTARQVIDNASDTTASDAENFGRESSGEGLGGSRTVGNNQGYIDKPGWLDAAAMFGPGMIGLGAKAASVGLNLNNVAATNKARESIGLENLGLGGTLSGAIRGTKGQVASVTIGDDDFSVGFEALSPAGQTNLTPTEARRRASAIGAQVKETPRDKALENARKFKEEYGAEKGLLGDAVEQTRSLFGGITKAAGSFIDNLFGGGSKRTSRLNDFPDRPSAPTERTSTNNTNQTAPANQNMSVAEQYGSYGAGKTGKFDGSDQAEAARDSEGLY